MPQKKQAKLIAVGELFTVNELMDALRLYKECYSKGECFASKAAEQIITDSVLARINDKTGQQNDRKYIAYLLEYAVQQAA